MEDATELMTHRESMSEIVRISFILALIIVQDLPHYALLQYTIAFPAKLFMFSSRKTDLLLN